MDRDSCREKTPRMEHEETVDSIIASMEWKEVVSLIEEAIQVMSAEANPPTAPTSSPPPLHEPQCHEDLYCGSWYSDGDIYDQGQYDVFPESLLEDPQCVGVLDDGVSVDNFLCDLYLPPSSCAPSPNTLNSRKRKYVRQQEDEGAYIKKPPNAFMLFLREQRPQVEPELKQKGSGAVNAVLGQKWKSLTKEQQATYYDQAAEERLLHEKLHPGWSPIENYGKKRKRCRSKAPTAAAFFQLVHPTSGPQTMATL